MTIRLLWLLKILRSRAKASNEDARVVKHVVMKQLCWRRHCRCSQCSAASRSSPHAHPNDPYLSPLPVAWNLDSRIVRISVSSRRASVIRISSCSEPVARNLDLRIAQNIRVEQTRARHGEHHRVFAAKKAMDDPEIATNAQTRVEATHMFARFASCRCDHRHRHLGRGVHGANDLPAPGLDQRKRDGSGPSHKSCSRT